MRANFWFTIAQHARAFGNQMIPRDFNIHHFITNVVDTPRGVLGQEGRNGRIFPKRVQKLDFGIGQINEYGGYPMLWLVHWLTYMSPK